ncbi:uncharacterized protein LOC119670755 [Teleopsis dalmanni]|uniref:uncharacterized protein LOC119670755 n=1 Tax=Teleopsis dalmanni TaxID=139649 RepID=UPI0018CF4AAA|nr:uncharacterized protein LOC119670755 [Teleopsis dalmanni]
MDKSESCKDDGVTNKKDQSQRKPGTHIWCKIAQEQALENKQNEMKERMLLLKKNKGRRNATDLVPKKAQKRTAQDRNNAIMKKRGKKEEQMEDTKNEEKECGKPVVEK